MRQAPEYLVRRKRSLLLGALGLIALLGAWLSLEIRRVPDPASTGVRDVRAAESSDGTAAEETDLRIESRAPVEARETTEARVPVSDRLPDSIPSAAIQHFGPGRLRIRAIDAETGSPVPRIRARVMSETRLADRTSERDGEGVEFSLSPGAYAILVMAKGYEATELTPRSIEAEKTTTLEPVAMHPGTAKILGAVTGDTWRPDTLWVELVGDGRRPCPVCVDAPSPSNRNPPTHGQKWSTADYCSRCGYSKSSSRLSVPPDGRFVFERLTSGPYVVRLMDAEERTLCDPRFFDLRAGQSLPVEVRFGAPRRVRVEIADVDGASLAPEWAARLRKEAAAEVTGSAQTLRVDSMSPPVDFHCQFRTENIEIGSSAFSPPPLDLVVSIVGPAVFGGRKLGTSAKHGQDRDDHPREKRDALRPELPPVNVNRAYYPSEVDPDGLVSFECVPSLELTLTMSSGPFTTTTAVPVSPDELHLQVMLHRSNSEKPDGQGEASTGAPTFREYELQRMR